MNETVEPATDSSAGSPSATAGHNELDRRSFWRGWWRLYLYVHLISVMGLSVLTMRDRAAYFHRSSWHDSAMSVGQVFVPAAPLAIPMAFASPMIIIIFLRRWANDDWRYGMAAAAEIAIAYANWYALLPAIQ